MIGILVHMAMQPVCFSPAVHDQKNPELLKLMINNGNWTEWSAIWAEIICTISDQNCMTKGSITTLLHPFGIA